MRILRFLDQEGQVLWGCDPLDGTAELLASPLPGAWMPRLERTGRRVRMGRLLAPATPPAIFGIGLNYRRHAIETGMAIPDRPVVFMKNPAALQDPEGPIRLPACSLRGPETDYEGELAVIIGHAALDVPEHRALEYVLGYTCANDVSARRWQKSGSGGQFVRGKSFDTFCPLGPMLVTPDEIPNPQALRIVTRLNGQVVQDESTGDMVFTVAQLIASLSMDMTLLPGTVILTGTPSGVGFARQPPLWLKAGDRVEVEIPGIGVLGNGVV